MVSDLGVNKSTIRDGCQKAEAGTLGRGLCPATVPHSHTLPIPMTTRAERAARRRATWNIVRLPEDDGKAPCPHDPGDRIAMVFALSERAWKLSGRPIPTYTRDEMPFRVIRRDDRE